MKALDQRKLSAVGVIGSSDYVSALSDNANLVFESCKFLYGSLATVTDIHDPFFSELMWVEQVSPTEMGVYVRARKPFCFHDDTYDYHINQLSVTSVSDGCH